MKKFKVKVFLISMILLITGGLASLSLAGDIANQDEFAELENSYESVAPKLKAAELSSTFTSEKEIEVYLEAERNDISKIVISGWSGGAYSKYKTTKNATYDETREIYTVTFDLDEIVNTNTGKTENTDETTYSFDACVYGTNGAMSYYSLDDVCYTKAGFIASTKTSGDNVSLKLNAVEDGEIAILKAGEEVTENTVWQSVAKGENTISLMSLEDETNEEAISSNVQTYSIVYKAQSLATMSSQDVSVVSTNSLASSSTFQNDDIFNFEISTSDGLNTWIAYEDTPNILESTIQGKHGETATAIIKINTPHAGILSFDYMSSSEKEFDTFKFEIFGATLINENGKATVTTKTQAGENDWQNYTGRFGIPTNGAITLKLEYKKDKNVNRYEDKAAIRNLIFTPILPTNGSVTINNGAEYTSSADLDLKIYVEDATYMYITENNIKPSVNSSEWMPLQERTTYTLKNLNDGEKTIYVWFKNDSNAMSIVPAKATIKLDNAAPTTTAPTLESTATEIKVKINQTDENEFVLTEYGYRLFGTSDEFIWSGNVNSGEHTLTNLTAMKEYEVKTRVSDGINDVVESDVSKIKTKIPSDKIEIESSPSEKTLDNVVVTITWNNSEGYTQKYSLNGINYTVEPKTVTTIEMPQNGIIYYQMDNGIYETGIQKYIVGNIDREGPKVASVEIVSPKSGKYGIGDEITIKVIWDEEIYASELPKLNIKFNDNVNIPLTAEYKTISEIVYKYTIDAEDNGMLKTVSLEGGEIKDSLQNTATYELPTQTGSEIYAENAAYIASTNTYYATIQNAVNAAKNNPTIITVTANTELRSTITIKEGQNITLDLNGKLVSIKNEGAIVTAMENSGILVIKDSTNTEGKITAYSEERSSYAIINNNTGNLTIENVKIEAISNTKSVALKTYGIYNKESGVITLGKDDGTVVRENPEIKAKAKNGIGIKLVDGNGRLYYCDGTIKGTSESLWLASGAAAYIIPTGYMEKVEKQIEEYGLYTVSYLSNENTVELTVDGKTERYLTLIDALSRVPTDGRTSKIKMLANDTLMQVAKIYEGQNIELDLNGYTITRNEAIDGIVYGILNNGILKITDSKTEKPGKIEAISQEDVKVYAIYNYTSGKLTIENIEIFAKNAGTNEAFGLDYTASATSVINLGSTKIYRDTLEKDKKYLNPIGVNLLEGKYLKQSTEIVEGITYKVSYGAETPNVSLTVNGTTTYHNSIQQAVNEAPIDGTKGEIKVLANEELYSSISIGANKNIELDLNGKTIIAKNMVEALYNSGNLIIKDTSENEEGVMKIVNTAQSTTIVNDSKTLQIDGGTFIADSTSTTNRSIWALRVNKANGTTIINGGKFKGLTNGIVIVPTGVSINNNGENLSGKLNLQQGKHLAFSIEDRFVTNYLAEGEIVATLEQNGTTSNYVSVQDAVRAVIDDGTKAKITMKESESLGGKIEILAGQNIELDLNGKEIYLGLTEKLIDNNGDIVISDSSNGNGRITGITNSTNGYLLYNGGTGKVEINGGNIYSKSTNNFSTIYNASTGNIIINGGKLNPAKTIENASTGKITINSGEIVFVDGTGTIKNTKGGNIEINGGNISSTGTSATVQNISIGTITMNDGKITTVRDAIQNTSTGIIIVNGGKLTVIDKNYSVITNSNLGNVYIYAGTLEGLGNGINNNSKGKIVIGKDDGILNDKPIIMANYAIRQNNIGSEVYFYDGILKGADKNIVYPSTTKFKSNETPSEKYYLIVTTDDGYLVNGRDGIYGTISYTDKENYEMTYTENGQNVVKRFASLRIALLEAPENTKVKITVLENSREDVYPEVTSKQNIVLDLNGKEILLNDSNNGLVNSGILQIIDSCENGAGKIEMIVKISEVSAINQYSTLGTLILGEDDGIVNTNKPVIISPLHYVINNTNSTVKMYDGMLIGPTPIFEGNGSKVIIPEGYKFINRVREGAIREGYLVKNEGISIVPETSKWVNDKLNVKILYSDSSLTNQYKINDGEWQSKVTYESGIARTVANIEVQENCTIYARAIDKDSNVIYSEEYEIKNIDKTAPTVENVTITTNSSSSQTITATGIRDNENGSGLKAYIVTMDTEKPAESAEWIESTSDSITATVNKNGTWYIYVKDNCGNISDGNSVVAQNIDIEAPIVTNIEVISPVTGSYSFGEVITIKVNFSEDIVISGTPILKIKFGEGEEKSLTSQNITSNAITYTYTVALEDEGNLTLVSYNGDGIKDTAGNAYIDNNIELIGSKIYLGTKAYIVETNKYYITIKEAIAACPNTATEYTTIKVINNIEYDAESIEILEGQKIKIDLNGKKIDISNVVETAIINNGDLTITDTSETQNGAINSDNVGQKKNAIKNAGTGKLQIDAGNITITGTGSYIYGIYCDTTGTVEINGGKISALSTTWYTYGLRIDNTKPKVIINGGEIKGKISGIFYPSNVKINNTGEATNGKITLPNGKYIESRIEDEYIINYLADGEYVVTLELNGETTNYLSIFNAIEAIPSDGTLGKITINRDIMLKDTLKIFAGQNVELDLNGKEICAQGISKAINNKGNLKIIDSSTNKNGKVNLIVNGSTLWNEANGTLEVNGATIELNGDNGNAAQISGTSNAIFKNAKIVANKTTGGRGIYTDGTGTIEIYSGLISSLANQSAYQQYYGMYINNKNAKIIIEGGEFKGRNGGIYIPDGMKVNNTGTYEAGKINIPQNTHIAHKEEDNYTVNYLASGSKFATLEVNGITTEYLSIYDAVMSAPSDGTYAKVTMHENEILSKRLEILQGQNIEIDLNGKIIEGTNYINNNGNIAINDTSVEQTGKIELNAPNCVIYNQGTGTVELKSGLLKAYAIAYSDRYGIYNNSTGTVKMTGGEINVETTHWGAGIYNATSGKIEFADGKIFVKTGLTGVGINNQTSGTVIMNGGVIYQANAGINNEQTGPVEINGGTIISNIYGVIRNRGNSNVVINAGSFSATNGRVISNESTGIITINGGTFSAKGNDGIINLGSKGTLNLNGGKIINAASSTMYTPQNRTINLPENMYLKVTQVKSGDSTVYVGELDTAGYYELTLQNGIVTYYNTLQEAVNAVPTDATFSKIKILTDCELSENINITTGKKVQLDLNGHTIKYYSTDKLAIAISNNSNQTFEVIDTSGDGLIDVKAEGYNATGINNAGGGSKVRFISGKMQVTSVGKEAYGIYNFNGTDSTVGAEAIRVEGGSISAKAEIGTNSAVSGKAYGIYNYLYCGTCITGNDTMITATSALNESYGIYSPQNNILTIGEKDGIVSTTSPYIAGETAGIYANKNISLYDGAIIGKAGSALKTSTTGNATEIVNNIEENTFVYTKSNNDGTETVTLLKNIQTLNVKPTEILSNNLETDYTLEISYMPVDAAEVKLQVESSNVNIAVINEIAEGVYSIRTKGEGSGEIVVTATDLSGKTLTKNLRLLVDTVAPSKTAPTATSTGSSVTITCNQQDENIDKNEIYYAISEDGITWSAWSKRATINGLKSDTAYKIKTKASDLLGNVSESEVAEISTKFANNSKFKFEPDTMTKENVVVTITWNNPQKTPQYYKVGSGEWTLETAETTTLEIQENNVTIYTKLIYDGTEESDIKSTTVDNIDRLAPTGTLTINEAYPRYDGYVTLKITATDDTSAVGDGLGNIAYMYIAEENLSDTLTEDDEGWIAYEGDLDAYDYYIQKGEGEVSIYVWLMDKARNISNALVATTEFVPPVAVLFEDDVLVGEYQSIAEAYNAARTNNENPSKIIVCQDNTMSAQLTIASNKNIILDLNGKHTTASINLAIVNNGNLEITDGKNGGVFTNENALDHTIRNYKNLKISGGTIEGINTLSNSNNGFTIYNDGKFEMTGGKIYAKKKSKMSSANYGAFALVNNSTYSDGPAVKITGGILEALGVENTCAYGIRNEKSSEVLITGGTIKAISENRDAYAIHSLNQNNKVTIGTNDGVVRDDEILIYGSTYGIYRSTGKFNFYDGTIKGADGKSIYCDFANINTPAQYGISKNTSENIETARLTLDSSAPTIGSIEITNDVNVYKQTITVKNVEDYGFGIVAYRFSNVATVPTKDSSAWTYIEATNGPIDFNIEVTKNGTYYFWATDAAGNISKTASVTAENIKIKVTGVTAANINAEVGVETQITVALTPTGAEAASIIYKSKDETIAHVDANTGALTGLKEGNTEITITAINYDGTTVSKVVTVTVTDPNKEPVESTKTAPTLEVGYKKITVTCNQTGENITNTYYAISRDGEDYSAWQENNLFENLETGKVYYVKTKIKTANGETESAVAMIAIPTYVASLEQNNNVTYYTNVQEAITSANVSGAKITMLESEIRASEITVATGKNIILDLNGCNISILGTATENLYGITNQGIIKIIDSKNTGKLLVSSENSTAIYGIYNNGGTIVLESIEVEVAKTNGAETTYAVYNNSGSTTIGDNATAVSTSKPKLTSSGYGIYNVNGTINYYDGLIIANKGKTVEGEINLADNYKITTENLGDQDKAYLTELKVDLENAIITEWQVPANTEITLPISVGENVDIVIDYGDGNVEWVKGNAFPKHTYQNAGTYQIKLSGTLSDFGNYNTSEVTTSSNYYTFTNYMTKLIKWGNLEIARYGFANCKKLNYIDNKPSRNTFKNVKDMQNMFYGCEIIKTLDLSNYSITNVTNMQNMFGKMTKLESMQVSNQFVVVANSEGIFENTDKLSAIIVSNKIPKTGAFTNVKESLSANVKFYVPTESAYEKSWASDYSSDRIEPILALVGKNPLRANINETYKDSGYKVAGFEMEKAELYNIYGYLVETEDIIDTSKEQTQTLTYKISRTYQSGTQTIKEELMEVTREIKVVALDKYMITEWNVSGDAGLEITLPVTGTGLNIIVDWGDGTEETITTEYPTHTYAKAGVYEIAVAGNCPEWGYVGNYEVTQTGNNSKYYTYTQYLTKVKQWGELNSKRYGFSKCINMTEVLNDKITEKTFANVNNMQNMFLGCIELKKVNLSKANFDNVSNMWSMFNGCSSLETLNLDNVSTNSLTTMGYMFHGCSSLKVLDLSYFNTKKVNDMSNMFRLCGNLIDLNLDNFDTNNVETMFNMFEGCTKIEKINLSSFKTPKLKTTMSMFKECNSLKIIDISGFNTSNVTTMSCMFGGCKSLEKLELEHFDTSNVNGMNDMFRECAKLTKLNLNNFDTSKVTNMARMFYGCKSLIELKVDSFDTINVKDMSYMFNSCTSLKELDINNFDTSKVTNMAFMFYNAKELETINLETFNTTNTTNMCGMIEDCLKLKNMLISEQFVICENSGNIFGKSKNLTAIITTSTTPVANQFKNELPSYTKLYVPNGCEEAYKEILSGDMDVSKIKPIVEPIGEKEIGILLGTSYEEQNYTVAGFGIEDVKYYMAYGYDVQTKGEVNTNEKGTYKIEYILTRTYTDKEGNEKQEQHIATRTVYVYDAPIIKLYENNKPYYGDWTNQDVIAVMNILSSETTWLSIKVENGDWTEEPSYANIEKSGDKMIVTFNTSLNGKVYFKEVDVTGNATTYQSEPSIIKIDKEKPYVQDMKAKTIDGIIRLEAKVQDELSGIEKYAITQSGETEKAWKKYENESGKIEAILPSSGTYYLWLKDVAGNESVGDYMSVIKDVEAPVGTIDIVATNVVSGDKYTNQDTVLINLNVTDNQTEQARIMYALYNEEDYEQVKAGTKEIEWKQYTKTVTWTLKEPQGINVIYAVFKDTAGNVTMTKGTAVQKP